MPVGVCGFARLSWVSVFTHARSFSENLARADEMEIVIGDPHPEILVGSLTDMVVWSARWSSRPRICLDSEPSATLRRLQDELNLNIGFTIKNRRVRAASLLGWLEKLSRDARSAPRTRPDFGVSEDFGHLVGLTQRKDMAVASSAARRKERAHGRAADGDSRSAVPAQAISGCEPIVPTPDGSPHVHYPAR